MDLGAVKGAEKSELIRCAVGAAANARDLLGDAEWLSAGVRHSPAQLAAMPQSRIAGILDDAHVFAQDLDRLKQHGLYADIDANGQIRLPSEVSGAELNAQLGQARRAVLAATLLLDPGIPAELADPPAESVELARALVDAFAEAGHSRTPKAAADVVLHAVRKFQKQIAESDASRPSVPAGHAQHGVRSST